MSIIHIDTDALQHSVDTFLKYSDDLFSQLTPIAQAWRQLPDHWQGNSAQVTYTMLEAFVSHLSEAAGTANYLGLELFQAKQLFEQADTTGLL